MSSFAVTVHRLHVEDHPNADRLAIGSIAGQDYRFVVGKDRTEGELGAYIPEASILPDALIEQMGIRQYLAGSEKNRVKAARLRGVLSQGLWYPLTDNVLCGNGVIEGDDIAESLGIVKWEPPVPQQLAGTARARPVGPGRDFWCDYDMENIKHYPDLFAEGEPVSITEKLHGTLLFVGLIDGEEVVTSKGLAHRNLVLEPSDDNLYWRVAREHHLFDKLRRMFGDKNAILFGEIVGVQDLKYGLTNGVTDFRAFDLYTTDGFFSPIPFASLCEAWEIPRVPALYEGPFSRATVDELTTGRSEIADHIREGVVIKPAVERRDDRVGRVILKSISPDYLTRKGDTTEFV